jgi:hypothetical protein
MQQNAPLVEIKHYATASADYAKAIIRVTHRNESRNNKSLLTSAIRDKLGNSLEPVPGSFTMISADTFSDTVSGVLRVIRQSIPFVEGTTRGFSSFASNMFMDTEKSIWVLKETDNGKLLVQTSSLEDESSLNDLLSSYSSTSAKFQPEHKQFVATASAIAAVVGGDLAYYVSKSGDSKVGYVVASVVEKGEEDRVMVIAHDSETTEVIPASLVLSKLDSSDAPEFDPSVQTGEALARSVITANTHQVALKDMLAYYKQVYKRRPDFYSMFEARLKAHAFL